MTKATRDKDHKTNSIERIVIKVNMAAQVKSECQIEESKVEIKSEDLFAFLNDAANCHDTNSEYSSSHL